MHLDNAHSAILSAVIFNALIIVGLIPLALRGVKFRALSAAAVLRRNLLVYGLGGLVAPFVGIKAIDLVVAAMGVSDAQIDAPSTAHRPAGHRRCSPCSWASSTRWRSPASARLAFKDQADGSLVAQDGRPVGSSLLGQSFTEPTYFHPRPSAAGDGYDPLASGGSNLGPSNQKLLDAVAERVAAGPGGERAGRRCSPCRSTPSPPPASGLDPQISVAYARLQAPRVADARGLAGRRVLRLVDEHTQARPLGFLGENGVNVLNLNLALDEMS